MRLRISPGRSWRRGSASRTRTMPSGPPSRSTSSVPRARPPLPTGAHTASSPTHWAGSIVTCTSTSAPRACNLQTRFRGDVQQLRAFESIPSDAQKPAWLDALGGLPTVYVTLGTMYNQNLDVFRTVLDGLRGDELNVVVTVGNQNDPAAFGPQPDNVQIHRFVPQDLVLPECTLAVIHGGAGSTVGALAFGLPLVLVPQGADQFFNTERVVAAGAGIGLLARAVQRGLGAPGRACAARRRGLPHRGREHRPRDRGHAGCRTRGRGAGTPRQQPWIAAPRPA